MAHTAVLLIDVIMELHLALEVDVSQMSTAVPPACVAPYITSTSVACRILWVKNTRWRTTAILKKNIKLP